jgi:hypothetical protein
LDPGVRVRCPTGGDLGARLAMHSTGLPGSQGGGIAPLALSFLPLTLRPGAGMGRALPAQVAELVDAQVSGTCGRKVVEVRVFSWAYPA